MWSRLSGACEEVGEPLEEGAARQHLADPCLPRGRDRLGLRVVRETDGCDGRQSRVGFHRRDGSEGIRARVVEIEDDEGRMPRAHVSQGAIARSRNRHRDTQLLGRRLDLGRKQQIVEDC